MQNTLLIFNQQLKIDENGIPIGRTVGANVEARALTCVLFRMTGDDPKIMKYYRSR